MPIWASFKSRLSAGGAWLAHHLRAHVREEWPAALFVPALFVVLEHFVVWVDAIDSYAFLFIGNFSAMRHMPEGRVLSPSPKAHAVVVLIDPHTHEQRYLERSPLDRCRLLEDVRSIYDAKPGRIAIDIDLSPARWLEEPGAARNEALECTQTPPATQSERAQELYCQRQLYCLIAERSQAVKTVIMQPIDVADRDFADRQRRWQQQMEDAGVRFGIAALPIDYGLVVKQYDHDESFAAVLEKFPSLQLPATTETQAVSARKESVFDPVSSKRKFIDPRHYVGGLHPLPLSAAFEQESSTARGNAMHTTCPTRDSKNAEIPFSQRLECVLHKHTLPSKEHGDKVVFFGAGYSIDDTFLTPLGELYGVEVQAAAYLSRLHPVLEAANKGLAFLGDVGLALSFGFVFALCWTGYFRHRLSPKAADRQKAPLFVVLLLFLSGALVVVFCWLSLFILRNFGVWLSPVPIAAGMFIDCFLSGSVQQAIREASRQQRPEPASLRESIHKFFVGDRRRLRAKGERTAAFWLELRRALWATVIVSAFLLILFGH